MPMLLHNNYDIIPGMGKIGLVLEGGAMRGLYTAGVLDVLMEKNIDTDLTIGVSAGACFGCNFISKQIGRTLRYNIKYAKDKRYCSIRSMIKTGDIYGAEFCYHTLPNELDVYDRDTFNKSKSEFYVVATNLVSGRPEYKRLAKMDDTDLEWMRASASMPLVSNIVRVEGYELLDGGTSDPIPVEKAFELGCDKCIVVLTRPEGYVKKPEPMLGFMKWFYRKYPAYYRTIEDRPRVYNHELELIDKLSEEGKIFVIRPSAPIPCGKVEHNPDNLQAAYELGRKDMRERLSGIAEFLK